MLNAETATPATAPAPQTVIIAAPTGQAVIKMDVLRKMTKELENAYELQRASRSAYKEKVKACAEQSGLAEPVIRAYICARMVEQSEQGEKKAEHARQLALVFEEAGL